MMESKFCHRYCVRSPVDHTSSSVRWTGLISWGGRGTLVETTLMNYKYLNFQEKTKEVIGFLSTQRRFVVALVCVTCSGGISFVERTEEIIFKLFL
jgi:hypothetical protein